MLSITIINWYQNFCLRLYLPDKRFGQLITIAPQSLTMLKTITVEFSFNEVWFTDQNNRPLEVVRECE